MNGLGFGCVDERSFTVDRRKEKRERVLRKMDCGVEPVSMRVLASRYCACLRPDRKGLHGGRLLICTESLRKFRLQNKN